MLAMSSPHFGLRDVLPEVTRHHSAKSVCWFVAGLFAWVWWYKLKVCLKSAISVLFLNLLLVRNMFQSTLTLQATDRQLCPPERVHQIQFPLSSVWTASNVQVATPLKNKTKVSVRFIMLFKCHNPRSVLRVATYHLHFKLLACLGRTGHVSFTAFLWGRDPPFGGCKAELVAGGITPLVWSCAPSFAGFCAGKEWQCLYGPSAV